MAAVVPLRTTNPATVSGQARLTIEQAFERFAATVTPIDRSSFQDTRLEDVKNAALQIEKDLATRRSLRNMRRLFPFLQGLEHYSKTTEVLCNGTPYLSWIWAPVKLMLQISSDYLSAFEKLIEAYGKIADALPRFDRLSAALKDDHDFQAVVALMYADILEIHRRAYKFLRQRSWKFLFGSMWANFDSRFKSILGNLAHHSDLIDKEAISIDIAASAKRRREELEHFEKQEREWKSAKLRAALSWLGFGGHFVDHTVDHLTQDCTPSVCDWFLQHPKIEPWLQAQGSSSVVWLHGKPGAGKSVLSASLVQHLEDIASPVFFYFCTYSDTSNNSSAYLFRTLVAQIVQAHPDTAIYVSDNYLTSHRAASRKALASLLPDLLSMVGKAHLVIDGIDEWDSREQQVILDDILPLATPKNSPYILKILVSSRDMPTISRVMRQKKRLAEVISLTEEHAFINRSIQSFISKKLEDYRSDLQDLDPKGSTLLEVRRMLVEKSNGMFLWVRLVIDSLDSVYTAEDLRHTVNLLPSGLTDLYERIILKICDPSNHIRSNKATTILQWICFAQRPIRISELLHGLAFDPAHSKPDITKVPIPEVLGLCKPLVEQRPDGTVGFVHFSVHEYLQSTIFSNSTDAHRLISCACISTITMGLSLLGSDSNQRNRVVSIVNGVYGLMKYALEFWSEHILSYAANGGDLSPGDVLIQCVMSLWSTHEHIQRGNYQPKIKTDLLNRDSGLEPQDIRLQLIAHLPIFELVRANLQLRVTTRKERSSDGKAMETFSMFNDRTLLTRLAIEFESWVLHLLSQISISGIPEDRLAKFNATFSSSAFRCRYPHCCSSSFGFATAALRSQHEATHFLRVYCDTTSCPWNRIGFRNEAALQNHVRSYHTNHTLRPTPGKIRLPSANASTGTIAKHDRSRLQDDWPPVFNYTLRTDAVSLAERYLDKVSPKYVREGEDWFAYFEPHQPRALDIELVNTLHLMSRVCSARFSLCGLYLAACTDRELVVFDVQKGQVVKIHHLGEGAALSMYVRDACFNPDSTKVIAVADDMFIRVWGLDGVICNHWKAHNQRINSLGISHDGSFIATASEDCTVKIWTSWTSMNSDPDMYHQNGMVTQLYCFDLNSGLVVHTAISSDCRLVTASCQDSTIKVFDVTSGSQIANLRGHIDAPCTAEFFPTGSQIISASSDKTVRIWELDPTIKRTSEMKHFGGHCINMIDGHADSVLSATITPDESWIISVSKDRSVRIVDAVTGAVQCIIIGHSNSVFKAHCSPKGDCFVTASGDETVRIWRYKAFVPSTEDETRNSPSAVTLAFDLMNRSKLQSYILKHYQIAHEGSHLGSWQHTIIPEERGGLAIILFELLQSPKADGDHSKLLWQTLAIEEGMFKASPSKEQYLSTMRKEAWRLRKERRVQL